MRKHFWNVGDWHKNAAVNSGALMEDGSRGKASECGADGRLRRKRFPDMPPQNKTTSLFKPSWKNYKAQASSEA